MTVTAHLERIRPAVDAALDDWLPPVGSPPDRLAEAMRYSVFAGGKRLRPALVAFAFEAVGGTGDAWLAPAAAVEMVHTYSLIHDDLPAMDDDDLRRGKPTCHRAFGEALAILAGDALHTEAFRVLAERVDDPARGQRLAAVLAVAAGAGGMVGGQVLDIAAEGGNVDPALAERIPALKTAALIRAAVEMGGIAAGAETYPLEALGFYGERVGLAFQVADDILDLQSTAEELGKTPGKDLLSDKLTLPSLLGVDGARARAEQWVAEATEAARSLGRRPGSAGKIEPLTELAAFILTRRS